MALIRFAEGQQRSGSIGGTVYSHNRFGAYVRARSIPVNPNTARQVIARNAARALTIAWENGISLVQRAGWETYAANVGWVNKLGDAVHLTGLNHFLRCNSPRLQNGIARIDDAPTIFNLATAELALACSASEATQAITVDGDGAADWIGEADAWQFFYMGIPQNSGIKFFGGPYRLLTAIPGAGPPPFPATPAAVFPFAVGQRIWVRSRIARGDGRLSEFAEVNFLADNGAAAAPKPPGSGKRAVVPTGNARRKL